MGHPASLVDGKSRSKPKATDKSVRPTQSNAVGALADQGKEFLARFLLVAEAAQHRGGDGGGVLLLDAAHHHAQVASLDDYAHALGFDYFLDGFGDLGGEALLDLQAAGKEFDETRDFAKADDFAVGDVRYVYFAEEWQQVVLAEAEHFYVLDDHHFVVGDGEERAFEQGFGIFGVAAGEELHGFANALGSLLEALAVRVFPEADEHFLDEIFEGSVGEGGQIFGLFSRARFHI